MSAESLEFPIKNKELSLEEQIKLQNRPKDFLTNTGENSAEFMLAQILIDKGLKELRIGKSWGNHEREKGIFGTIKAKEIMRRIGQTPEYDVIFKANNMPDIKLESKDFVAVKLEQFKSTKLREEFQILQLKKHVERLKDLFPSSADNAQMNRFTEKEEEKLNQFVASGVHILTDDEIKALIEVIVNANTNSEELMDETERKRSLSARDIADLDPYGVRSN